jgi:hypothetical protein
MPSSMESAAILAGHSEIAMFGVRRCECMLASDASSIVNLCRDCLSIKLIILKRPHAFGFRCVTLVIVTQKESKIK